MPDLLAGSVVSALDTPPTVADRQDGTVGSVSSAVIGTSYATTWGGSTVCGVAFSAPTTGRVLLHYAAELDNSSMVTLVAPRVGDGATVGSGTEIVAPQDQIAISNAGTNQVRCGASLLVDGLTPGATYNAALSMRVTGGNGAVSRRIVIVAPAT